MKLLCFRTVVCQIIQEALLYPVNSIRMYLIDMDVVVLNLSITENFDRRFVRGFLKSLFQNSIQWVSTGCGRYSCRSCTFTGSSVSFMLSCLIKGRVEIVGCPIPLLRTGWFCGP